MPFHQASAMMLLVPFLVAYDMSPGGQSAIVHLPDPDLTSVITVHASPGASHRYRAQFPGDLPDS